MCVIYRMYILLCKGLKEIGRWTKQKNRARKSRKLGVQCVQTIAWGDEAIFSKCEGVGSSSGSVVRNRHLFLCSECSIYVCAYTDTRVYEYKYFCARAACAECCYTYEWSTSHIEWVISHVWMSHVTHMKESCHTREWVMSHMWMRHVTHVNELCHTELIWDPSSTTQVNESCHTYERVMSHIWKSHVTRMKERARDEKRRRNAGEMHRSWSKSACRSHSSTPIAVSILHMRRILHAIRHLMACHVR